MAPPLSHPNRGAVVPAPAMPTALPDRTSSEQAPTPSTYFCSRVTRFRFRRRTAASALAQPRESAAPDSTSRGRPDVCFCAKAHRRPGRLLGDGGGRADRPAAGEEHVAHETRGDTCVRARGVFSYGRRRGCGLREQPRPGSCLASSSLPLRVKVNGGRAVALYGRASALIGRPTGTSGCRSRRTPRCSRSRPRARACPGCTTRVG